MSDITAIAVPKWGIEMVEGTVNVWNKAVGDTVAKGDEILEMESDKIVNVWESPADGVLRRVLVEEGEARPVGALLGVIAAAGVDDASIDSFIAAFGGDDSSAPAGVAQEKETTSPAPAAKAGPGGDAATRSAPAVRKLATELGVDLNTVTGTGRRGRITEDDVRAAASGGAEPAASGVEITPLSATRQTIAKRLTEAKQAIPHFYLTVDYELDGLLSHREALNNGATTRVSVNDLLVKCVAQALQREPRVNVNVIDGAIHQFSDSNVSVAIATDDGLYPATIRAAQNMSAQEIGAATAALAERARNGALTREDISDGSFTVSNLGMFGIDSFTAIINPPMGAILALGKGSPRPVVREGEVTVATTVSATLSCDHRVIDGAIGANFLKVLGEEIASLA